MSVTELLSDPVVWTSAGGVALFLLERFAPPWFVFFNKAGKLAYELLQLHDKQKKSNKSLAIEAELASLRKAAKALEKISKK